jgi:hypothetical protein
VTQSFERLTPYVGRALGLSEDALSRACRPARPSELPAVLALRRSVLAEMWWDDDRFVRWRYFSGAAEPPFWVFVKDGEMLAGCGLEPITLVVDGVPMPAVRTLDIMVRPDLDGLGLGAFINLVLFRNFPITLVTGSNERSHNLLIRMFHHTTDLHFWKTPRRARAIVGARLGPGVVSAIATWSVDLLLSIKRRISHVPSPTGITIRDIDRFDARVTDLSQRCEVRGRVLVRRSDAYLNWRFAENPRCHYTVYGAFAGDRLDGYVVTRYNLARPNPRREAEIVDWLVAPGAASAGLLAALVHAAVDGLAAAGAWIITCAAVDRGIAPVVEAAGFRFRPGERLPFFSRASDAALHERLCVGGDWFLTRGDFDVE